MFTTSYVLADTVGIYNESDYTEDRDINIFNDDVVCTFELTDLLYSKKFSHVKNKDEIVNAICVNHVKYDVPYRVIAAIIYTESTFKVKAKNGSNIGLMQINTKYHKTKELHTIIGNIGYGVKYIKELLDQTGNIKKAISRYNGGDNNKVYISKIMKAEKKLFS